MATIFHLEEEVDEPRRRSVTRLMDMPIALVGPTRIASCLALVKPV
jgi:hypothetical protein